MMKVKYEEVKLSLASEAPKSQRDLHKFLVNRNFKTMDDQYFKLRTDRVPKWQIDEIACIKLKYQGDELYSTAEDILENDATWDTLDMSYLLSALPRDYIKKFVDEVAEISDEFNLSINMDEETLTVDKLSKKMNSLADELEADMGEAGSEIVAILVEMEYS